MPAASSSASGRSSAVADATDGGINWWDLCTNGKKKRDELSYSQLVATIKKAKADDLDDHTAAVLPVACSDIQLPAIPRAFTLKVPTERAIELAQPHELENATYMALRFDGSSSRKSSSSYLLWDDDERCRQIGLSMLHAKNSGRGRSILFVGRKIERKQAAEAINFLAADEDASSSEEDGDSVDSGCLAANLVTFEWCQFLQALKNKKKAEAKAAKEAIDVKVEADDEDEAASVSDEDEDMKDGSEEHDDQQEKEDDEEQQEQESSTKKVDLQELMATANVLIIDYDEYSRATAHDVLRLSQWFRGGDTSDEDGGAECTRSGIVAFEDAERIATVDFKAEEKAEAVEGEEVDEQGNNNKNATTSTVSSSTKIAKYSQMLLELCPGSSIIYASAAPIGRQGAKTGSLEHLRSTGIFGNKRLPFAVWVEEFGNSEAKRILDAARGVLAKKNGLDEKEDDEEEDSGGEKSPLSPDSMKKLVGTINPWNDGKQLQRELEHRFDLAGGELLCSHLRASGIMSNRVTNNALHDAENTTVNEVVVGDDSESASLVRDLRLLLARLKSELALFLDDPELMQAYEHQWNQNKANIYNNGKNGASGFPQVRTKVYRFYWSVVHDCFQVLMSHCKMEAAIELAEKELEQEKQVVLMIEGHMSSSERARFREIKNDMMQTGEDVEGRTLATLLACDRELLRRKEEEENNMLPSKEEEENSVDDASSSASAEQGALGAAPPELLFESATLLQQRALLPGLLEDRLANAIETLLPVYIPVPGLAEQRKQKASKQAKMQAAAMKKGGKMTMKMAKAGMKKMNVVKNKMMKKQAAPAAMKKVPVMKATAVAAKQSKMKSARGVPTASKKEELWPATAWLLSKKHLLRRRALLKAVHSIPWPSKTVDSLLDRFGGPTKVAEITGRYFRWERKTYYSDEPEDAAANTRFVFVDRNQEAGMGAVRHEKEATAFRMGAKAVAICSKMASKKAQLGPRKKTDVDAIGEAAMQLAGVDRSLSQPVSARTVICLDLPRDAKDLQSIRSMVTGGAGDEANSVTIKVLRTDYAAEIGSLATMTGRLRRTNALTKGDRSLEVEDFNHVDVNDGKIAKRAFDILADELKTTTAPVWRPSAASGAKKASTSSKVSSASAAALNKSDGSSTEHQHDAGEQEEDGELETSARGPGKKERLLPTEDEDDAPPAKTMKKQSVDYYASAPQFIAEFWHDQRAFACGHADQKLSPQAWNNWRNYARGELQAAGVHNFDALADQVDAVEEDDAEAAPSVPAATNSLGVKQFYLRLHTVPTQLQTQLHCFFLHIRKALERELNQTQYFHNGIAALGEKHKAEPEVDKSEILYRNPETGATCTLVTAEVDRGTTWQDVYENYATLLTTSRNQGTLRQDYKEFCSRPADEQEARKALGSMMGTGNKATGPLMLDNLFNLCGFWRYDGDGMKQLIFVQGETDSCGRVTHLTLHAPNLSFATEFPHLAPLIDPDSKHGTRGVSGMTRSSSLLDGAKTKKRSRSQKKTAVKPGNSEQDGDDADLLAVDNDSFEEEDHENQGTTSTTTTSTSTNIILGPNRCTPLTRPILEANFTKVEHEGEHKDAFEKEWRKHWTHLYKETEKNNLMDVVSTYKEINGLTSSSSEQENNTNTNLDSEIEQDNATNSSRSSLGRRVSPMYLLHGNFLDLAALSANLFTCGKGKTAAVRREYVEGIGYTVVIDPSKVEIVRDAGKMLKKTGSTVNSLLERLNLGEYPQELVEELQAVGDDETNVLVPQGFAMTRADRAVLKTIRSTLDESSKETTEDAEEDAFGGDDAGQQKTKNTLDFSNCNTSIECALEFTKALWASGWDNRTGLILAAHAFKRFTDPTRAEFLYRELDYSTGKPKAKPGYKICSSMVELCIDEPAEYYRLLKQELQDEDMPKSKAVTALKKRVKKLRAEGGADEDIKKEEQADTEEEAGPSGKRKKLS